MPYTFWHCGILIGESDFEEPRKHPRKRGGVFRPTAYGLEIFPRLTGILSAGHALVAYLEANGKSPDTMEKDEVEEILETNPAGQKIIDIGRTLSEVEMRSPEGRTLEFASIGFSDLLEFRMLARELDSDAAQESAEWPADVPRYVVSATLKKFATKTWKRAGRTRGRPWPNDN